MFIHFVEMVPDLVKATEIASLGFVQPLSDALREDVEVHLTHGRIVYSILNDEELVGFAIFNQFGQILYLSGIILKPEYQGKKIGAQAVAHAHKQTGTKFLALRTQSLRMWCAGKFVSRHWFPNPESHLSEELTDAHQKLLEIMGVHASVVEGFYQGALYGSKPDYRDAALQQWWDSICNFNRGDAVLCIGLLP